MSDLKTNGHISDLTVLIARCYLTILTDFTALYCLNLNRYPVYLMKWFHVHKSQTIAAKLKDNEQNESTNKTVRNNRTKKEIRFGGSNSISVLNWEKDSQLFEECSSDPAQDSCKVVKQTK